MDEWLGWIGLDWRGLGLALGEEDWRDFANRVGCDLVREDDILCLLESEREARRLR